MGASSLIRSRNKSRARAHGALLRGNCMKKPRMTGLFFIRCLQDQAFFFLAMP